MSDLACPCQSGKSYAECCQPYHQRKVHAPTAEALMRSRYCAYALATKTPALLDYLINTTHRENSQYTSNTKHWRSEILRYCQTTGFKGLVIKGYEYPLSEAQLNENPIGLMLKAHWPDLLATVAFEASLVRDGKPYTLKELSFFVKLGNRWVYHTGDVETV